MNVRFDVPHEGKAKMVGKLFEHGGSHYFLHEIKAESQGHRNLNSPGGLDVALIDKLLRLRPVVGEVTIIHRQKSGTWTTDPDTVRTCGLHVQSGGRDRYFLEWAFWKPTPVAITVNPHVTTTVLLDDPPPTTSKPREATPPAPTEPTAPFTQKGFAI